MKILVTGGAGFIGSAVVRYAIQKAGHEVLNFDKLTYAGNLESLRDVKHHPKYRFVKGDICQRSQVAEAIKSFQPDAIMHLAAESHVDRSIEGPSAFIETNVVGTFTLLDEAMRYYKELNDSRKTRFRFHHISTDEVFGTLGETGYFREDTAYQPNSPYSASKAGSDHLVRAWHHTYHLPTVMTNCSNNYGPFQFPEKLIPHMIIRALDGRSLPVYGKGVNIRDWLHVDDHVTALLAVLECGKAGETYNIGGNAERKNIDVVKSICAILDKKQPRTKGRYEEQIEFVTDRPGHDMRYAIDCQKIQRELGWKPSHSFESGLEQTIGWYLENAWWWKNILSGQYKAERAGLV